MKKLISTCFAIFALVLYVAANAQAPATTKNMTNAEVRKIDKEAGKITLKHEDIKNLDMPGMTMVFQVTDKALLDKVQVGDKVKFIADKQQGKFVVTDIQTTSGVK
jgi:Cu/Ag efflux protein CusF